MTASDGDDLPTFAEPVLLILVALTAGPRHGYAIIQDVESFSGIRLGPGTLYAALSRLEQRRLIEPLPPVDRRRPYRLTARGSELLVTRLRALDALTALGLDRIGNAT